MTLELSPELQKVLQKATQTVDAVRRLYQDPECTNLAETWTAYLTEYVYASAAAFEALQRGDNEAAATHRLAAACHDARAGRKSKDLRRAIERYLDDHPT